MPRQIPIVGGFYKDPDRHWSRQDCLNWIPVKAERPGTLTEWALRDAPGLKPYVEIADDTGGIRGARNVEGKLFVVWRSTLYQISNTGVAIPIGTIPGVGRVSMAHNANGLGNELLVVNGSAGYVYNTLTGVFGKITDPGYPGAFVADFVDQYLAQVEPQGRYWFHSDLADATAYNTIDRYQAEGDPDRIVSLLVSHREVLIFGADTIEPYVNTGGSTGTFQRASNTVIECGCAARFTPRRLDSSAFWLDDQRLVRRLDGYTPAILSTEAIAGAFAECSEAEIAQAYAFTWEGGGHKVYYITVPNRFTFGYDAKTGEWHRRASYGLPHWAVSEIVFWNGKWYACDSRRPRLFELDSSYKLDGCDPLVRERSAQVIWADQNEVTLDELELMFGTPSAASECVPFPAQPVGPTITGSAPNGSVGIAYAGYTYTVTAGDAPIADVQVVSGEIPAGLVFNPVGAIDAGTPTEPGTFTFTQKATDANGLFDDHDDTVYIQQVLLATGEDALDDPVVLRVPDSLDWTAPYGTFPGDLTIATEMLGIPGRGLAWNVNLMAKTDDYGLSWQMTSANLGGAGGARKGAFKDGLLLIAGGNSTMHKSSDNGSTTSTVTGSPNSNWLAWAGDRLVSAYNGHTTLRYSDSTAAQFIAGTQSFSTGGTHGLDLSVVGSVHSYAGCWMLGARIGTKPALAITEDGVAITNVTFSSAANGYVSAIIAAEVEGEEIWVIATSAGELYWSDDRFDTYAACTINGTTPILVCGVFDGIRYVFGGAIPTDYVATSLDGKTFDVNTNTSIVGGITAMCTVPPP